MIASLQRLIESALELDHTLSREDSETILACCRSPAKFREKDREPEERLLRVSQVAKMLATSRTTLWRLSKAEKLHPVLIGDSTKFRESEVRALMEANMHSDRQG